MIFRLIVLIDYRFLLIFIRFIGTHKQYDKIDAKRFDYGDNDQLKQNKIIIQP